MRFSRLMLTGSTLLALTLVGGCSGDSASPEGDSSSSTSAKDKEPATAKSRGCKASVEVTGAATASWQGKAQAEVQKGATPPAFYVSSKGKDTISVYAAGEDFEHSAVVQVGGATFTTEQGADGLDVKANGKGATVDAEATGVEPESTVRIVANFSC